MLQLSDEIFRDLLAGFLFGLEPACHTTTPGPGGPGLGVAVFWFHNAFLAATLGQAIRLLERGAICFGNGTDTP
jgi:hypothetical protein